MRYTYLIVCIILMVPFALNIWVTNDLQDLKMADFINVALYVTKRFISPKTTTLIIMEECEFVCEEIKKYHTTLLYHFLNNLNDTLTIQLLFAQPEYRPWDYNLFVVDSWAAFDSLRIIIPSTEHERDFYFFILLTWSSDFMLPRNLNKIFELCLHINVNNVVVMAKFRLSNFIGFYSYQIFSSDNCDYKLTSLEINRFEKGRLKHEFLFPKQLNNYFGCSLSVSAQIYAPLLTFDGDIKNQDHLKDMKRLGGIEGEILKLLAEALNFTIHMHFRRELSTININSNSTGCFKDLEEKTAHVAIGALSSTMKNNEKFTQTFAYHTTAYKFVVRSNVFFGSIKQLVNPFSKSTWMLLLALFAISITVIQIIVLLKSPKTSNFIFGNRNKDPTFNLFLTFLGYSMSNRLLPKRNFARFILMLWLLFGFLMRNGYQGKMFDSLRLAKRKPVPKTIGELIAMDYTLLSSAYTSFYPIHKTSIGYDYSSVLQQLQSSEKPITGAFISDALIHYNFLNRNSSSLTSVAESIFSYQCVMYLRKNSILRESFERKLKLFTYSGITSHIAKQHVRSDFEDMTSRSQDVGTIKFRNLKGLYYICGSMFQISLVMFVLELLTKRSQKLKRIMDRLN